MGESSTEFSAPMLITDEMRASASTTDAKSLMSVGQTGYRISFEQFMQILKESLVRSANGIRGNYLTNRTLNFNKIKKPKGRHASLPKIEENGTATPQDLYQDNLNEFWTRSLRQRSQGTHSDNESVQRETISQLKNRKRGSKSFELGERHIYGSNASKLNSDMNTQLPSHRTLRSNVVGNSADSKLDTSHDEATADIKS